MREGESEGRLEKREERMERMWVVSSEAGVEDDFDFFEAWRRQKLRWEVMRQDEKAFFSGEVAGRFELTHLAHESREQIFETHRLHESFTTLCTSLT